MAVEVCQCDRLKCRVYVIHTDLMRSKGPRDPSAAQVKMGRCAGLCGFVDFANHLALSHRVLPPDLRLDVT